MLKTANTRSQQRKNRTKNIITVIMVIVTILIVGGLITYMAIYNHNKALSAQNNDNNGADINNPDVNTAYYNEVHYVGGIGYKDVYEMAFSPSYVDDYVSNKTIYASWNSDIIDKALETARNFSEEAFNISYRSMQSNPDIYKDALLKYMHERSLYRTPYTPTEMDYLLSDELLDEIINYLIDNEVTCEAEYKTDSSLVYCCDGYIFVRGVIELSIFNAKEGSYFDFPKNEKIPIMIDYKLYNDSEAAGYRIIDISRGIVLKEDGNTWWTEKEFQGDVLHRIY